MLLSGAGISIGHNNASNQLVFGTVRKQPVVLGCRMIRAGEMFVAAGVFVFEAAVLLFGLFLRQRVIGIIFRHNITSW